MNHVKTTFFTLILASFYCTMYSASQESRSQGPSSKTSSNQSHYQRLYAPFDADNDLLKEKYKQFTKIAELLNFKSSNEKDKWLAQLTIAYETLDDSERRIEYNKTVLLLQHNEEDQQWYHQESLTPVNPKKVPMLPKKYNNENERVTLSAKEHEELLQAIQEAQTDSEQASPQSPHFTTPKLLLSTQSITAPLVPEKIISHDKKSQKNHRKIFIKSNSKNKKTDSFSNA